jgi:hypothetical protein
MASPAYDISTLLVAQGIGTAGTDIFVGKEPATDTLSILLLDAGGPAPNPAFARDFIDLQIVVSGAVNSYSIAYDKAKEIKNYLLGLDSQTVGTTIYFAFNMRSDITFVGYDSNDRPKFTLNFRLIVDSANVGNRLSL